jgi:hypothetical protein
MCTENFLNVRENYDIFGMSQNQVKTLSWINSGKSNITPPPPPPKGKFLSTALASISTNQNLPYYSPCMQKYNQLHNRVISTI